MMIAFIHPHKAFLPEIAAYQAFFEKFGIRTQVASPIQTNTLDADVEWFFMGRASQPNKNKTVIHEYTSASTPPCAPLKNLIKRLTTPNPSHHRPNPKNNMISSTLAPWTKPDSSINCLPISLPVR